jgi:hypothetical protein
VERRPLELGDLVEHWTLVGAERGLVTAKNYDSQLGFALLLKFYGRFGRFPRGRSELHDDAVEFVARQLGVGAGSVGFYEWTGRTAIRHRAEIRAHSASGSTPSRTPMTSPGGWPPGTRRRNAVTS